MKTNETNLIKKWFRRTSGISGFKATSIKKKKTKLNDEKTAHTYRMVSAKRQVVLRAWHVDDELSTLECSSDVVY